MKKILVVLSMACFVAVFAANAQSPASSAKAGNTEASVQKSDIAAKENPAAAKEAAHPGCCQKGASAKSCCKAGQSMSKACTPEERAKCAEKMKAEAAADTKENSDVIKD